MKLTKLLIIINIVHRFQATTSLSSVKSNLIKTKILLNNEKSKDIDINIINIDNYKIASSIAKSERREKERSSSNNPRPQCNNCKRPTSICICHTLPKNNSGPLLTETRILILQHPTEFRTKKTISTVPIIPLVIKNCKVIVGYEFENNVIEELDWVKEVIERGEKPLLLFPGPDSIDLNEYLASEEARSDSNHDDIFDVNNDQILLNNNEDISTSSKSKLLILIDGTWTQAKRIARVSPRLLSLCQKVPFTTIKKNQYIMLYVKNQKIIIYQH